jgi:protein-S-isoprenylcysteine O-methyltransferase Ste14
MSNTNLTSNAGSTDRMARGNQIPLLARMQRDLSTQGSLRPSTVVAMYLAYGVHATVTAAALRDRWLPLPFPRGAARLTGGTLIVAGTALCAFGMRRFAGPAQVSGTQSGPLVTGGVYRYSRNPQYLGYILALTGVAVARRSAISLALAGAAAATYAVWVPIEEEQLTRTLGPAYEQYRRGTSRWWGRPRDHQ